ncbi:MAG: hypothetical protein QM757_05165 [Paludibaculum sp.]
MQIDNSSGHYKPNKTQLQAVVQILRDDFEVDFALCDIALFEKDPNPEAIAPLVSAWRAGRVDAFLDGGAAG